MQPTIKWHKWSEIALASAQKQNKPIFLSVGYFTCYWCHVMEQKVYTHPDFVEAMNQNYICIKIDKDERPDLDEIYMMARQLITGHSGWPNHVFLTPSGDPFLAAGVLTRTSGEGKTLLSVANEVTKKWQENSHNITDAAQKVAEVVRAELSNAGTAKNDSVPDKSVTEDFFNYLKKHYDAEHGGFYHKPKFPHENYLLFLLADYRYRQDNEALEMASLSLKKMAAGGIYDHIGGGFHRYTEDRTWSVPHFEKMLYTQALQARCLVELYDAMGKSYHRDLACETIDFVLRELAAPEGVFYSAIDAETDGVEGAYYVWTEQQLKDALEPKQAELFAKCYQLSEIPTLEGHAKVEGSVLRARQNLVAMANEKNRSYESLHADLIPIFAKLREVRSQRKRPEIDTKIITAWNALMVETLAEASKITAQPRYRDAAETAAEFIWTRMRLDDGCLAREWKNGKVFEHGYLEDYAYTISAMLTLYEVGADKKWLDRAIELHRFTDELFWDDKEGGYFITDGKEKLLVRIHRAHDNGLPSASGEMLHNLMRLHDATNDELWLGKARLMMATYHTQMAQSPQDYSTMLQAILTLYR